MIWGALSLVLLLIVARQINIQVADFRARVYKLPDNPPPPDRVRLVRLFFHRSTFSFCLSAGLWSASRIREVYLTGLAETPYKIRSVGESATITDIRIAFMWWTVLFSFRVSKWRVSL